MTIQHKRRTFKEVAEQGYAKGWEQGYAKGGSDGREAARVEFEAAYNLLCKHTNAMELEASQLRERLDNMSPGRLLWSRLTGLFKGVRYDH
jgi:flagellar biosynthesis/type III secretory pathway protein FliH